MRELSAGKPHRSSRTALSGQLIAPLKQVQLFSDRRPMAPTLRLKRRTGGSAHPLAARLAGYLSLVSVRKGRRSLLVHRDAEAQRQVAGLREHLAQLERDGHDTAQGTRLLAQYEEVLAMHVADRRVVQHRATARQQR